MYQKYNSKYSTVSTAGDNPPPVEVNTLIDGFRLDFDVKEFKLNIEIDGPTHKYVQMTPSALYYCALRVVYCICLFDVFHV